ncbi:hypothetical protein V6N12_010082 [Hibiscus sabdariffa]|uniref:Uncharacterized protein n=1 Tax=Hibiscus sabdariffa TaxID=183260 RepID=A0ABR2EGB4_9ROSI
MNLFVARGRIPRKVLRTQASKNLAIPTSFLPVAFLIFSYFCLHMPTTNQMSLLAPNRTHSFLHFNLRLPFYLSFSSRHSNLKRSRGIQINARCYDDFSRLGALRVQWNQVPYSGCKAEEEGEWAQPHQQLAFSTRKELKMKQESVFTIYEPLNSNFFIGVNSKVPYSGCKVEEEGEWAQPHQQLAFSTRKELKMKQESVFTIYEVECFE